jgi:hypothetical protein
MRQVPPPNVTPGKALLRRDVIAQLNELQHELDNGQKDHAERRLIELRLQLDRDDVLGEEWGAIQ